MGRTGRASPDRATPSLRDGRDAHRAPLPPVRPLPVPDLYLHPPPPAVPVDRPAGWYRNVADPTLFRYWDGVLWIEPASAPLPQPDSPPEPTPSPARRDRRPHSRPAVTATQALAVVLSLAALVTVALVSSRSAGSVAHPGSTVPPAAVLSTTSSSSTPSTTTAAAAQSTPADQVVQWWTATGSPTTSGLAADLQTMEGHPADMTSLASDCIALATQAQSVASSPPAPVPAIQREWQLVISTTGRVAAACAAQRYANALTDGQPALYTIGDLTHQIDPYLAGRAP